jgi:hypothetical protein
MGLFCNDQSMTALSKLGYNVVRHPSANFRPLLLIGKQSGEFIQLGPLNQLITRREGAPWARCRSQRGRTSATR